MKEIKITNQEQNQRLDKYLMKYFNKAPKSFIYKMLRKKRIKLNTKKAEGSEILKDGDLIAMYLSPETIDSFTEEKTIEKADRNFMLIYEDDNILICSKPAGLIVHPDKENEKNTLNDQLLYYLYEKNEYDISKEASFKPAICNRLDRNTSGIVVLGKNLAAVQALNKAFKDNEIDKYYLCVVKGKMVGKGKLRGYHIKHEDNTVEIHDTPVEGSKEVITLYNALDYKNGMTLLRIKLVTGKSHQIRAGLKKAGHPVVGDRKYGDRSLNMQLKSEFGLDNQLLHCCEIVFKQKNTVLDYLYNRSIKAEPSGNMKKLIDIFDYNF